MAITVDSNTPGTKIPRKGPSRMGLLPPPHVPRRVSRWPPQSGVALRQLSPDWRKQKLTAFCKGRGMVHAQDSTRWPAPTPGLSP